MRNEYSAGKEGEPWPRETVRIIRRRRQLSVSYVGSAALASAQPSSDSRRAGGRGAITAWTAGMRRRLGMFADNFRLDWRGMLTLTYRSENAPRDGAQVKRDLKTFAQAMRRAGYVGGEREGAALWFLEFTAAGAPHVHVLVTEWLSIPWVSETWARITGGNRAACTRVEALRRPRAGAMYARKYAQKQEQKEVPADFLSVGRFWGCWGARGHRRDPECLVNSEPRAGACARAREQACPRVAADMRGASAGLLERMVRRGGWSVRVYETPSGFVVYGDESKLEDVWRFLLAVERFADLRERVLVATPPAMLGGSYA